MHCDQKLVRLSNQNAFSALDVAKVERAKAGKTNSVE